jgi:hypothetical protein
MFLKCLKSEMLNLFAEGEGRDCIDSVFGKVPEIMPITCETWHSDVAAENHFGRISSVAGTQLSTKGALGLGKAQHPTQHTWKHRMSAAEAE